MFCVSWHLVDSYLSPFLLLPSSSLSLSLSQQDIISRRDPQHLPSSSLFITSICTSLDYSYSLWTCDVTRLWLASVTPDLHVFIKMIPPLRSPLRTRTQFSFHIYCYYIPTYNRAIESFHRRKRREKIGHIPNSGHRTSPHKNARCKKRPPLVIPRSLPPSFPWIPGPIVSENTSDLRTLETFELRRPRGRRSRECKNKPPPPRYGVLSMRVCAVVAVPPVVLFAVIRMELRYPAVRRTFRTSWTDAG